MVKQVPRLIDADALEKYLLERGFYPALVKAAIKNAPSVDAESVIRCKDCKHAERYERADGGTGYYCGHPQNSFTYGERWNRVFKPVKEANDFCSCGAKMDEETEGNDG